jgi:hypothetical protein
VGDNGDLTLTNTTVSGGRAVGETSSSYDAGEGGGVFVEDGTLTLTNTTISGNSASQGGGGIDAYYGVVNVTSSTISGNTGSGVRGFDGGFTITRSSISGNTGSGISLEYSDLDLTNSTVSNNQGDGIVDGSSEGGSGSITVTRSTISGNSETGVTGQSTYNMSITNSTISGNDQGLAGGTDEGLDLELTHSTITRNAREGIFAAAGNYGSSMTLNRSLISGNRGGEVVVEQSDYDSEASITADNFNVFGYNGNARVTNFEPGPTDIVPNRPLDAVLNTNLANNGGFTRTHALPAGSPAIDTVSDGTCPPPAIDQRGVTRPRDGNGDGGPACDTGAFER